MPPKAEELRHGEYMMRSRFGMLIAGLLWAATAHAVTFVPTAGWDAQDFNPGDGICDAVPGNAYVCTLRAAVMEGNLVAKQFPVEITLQPGMAFQLSIPGPNGGDDASVGDLEINRPMRIGIPEGATPAAKIDGNQLGRMFKFSIFAGPSVLYGVDLFNGSTAGSDAAVVDTYADIYLQRIEVSGSRGSNANGQCAIKLSGYPDKSATLQLFESRVHGNNIEQAQISGICAVSADSTIIIDRSTVDTNFEGINVQNGANLIVTNSTISNNTIDGISSSNSKVVVRSSTLSSNGLNGYGGQVHVSSAPGMGSLTIVSSILDGSKSIACRLYSPQNGYYSFAFNIYGDRPNATSCQGASQFDTGSIYSADPRLSDLDDWGGPTPTQVPLQGSAAIDFVPANLCAEYDIDQNGLPRIVSYSGQQPARCDAGSVELPKNPEPPENEIFRDGLESAP